jgi:two-component system nitrogen regulation sensor histidine kinase GlnL
MAKTKEKISEAPSAILLMGALPDAVVGFDRDLCVYFSNNAAQHFFCLSEKQMLAENMSALLGEKQAVFEVVETAVRKNNQTVTLHDAVIGDTMVTSVVVATVEADAWYMMVIRQQPLQPASEWNEKTRYTLQSTQMLAQMLAHEVKNPLAGIRGAAQLLEKSKVSAEDKELVNLIGRETQRIQGLVDKFNIFYEVPQNQYKNVNLHEVLIHVTKVAQAQFGPDIKIVEQFDPSLPEIKGHFDHLVQATLNLVKNAAEAFAGTAGKITIRTYYDNAAPYHPERPEKLPLCIEIEDDGQGITPEAISRIFQPYFTTKANGQGLGLPIVSKIVDDHGGTIDVSSKPERTVFKISLPVSSDVGRK